MGAPSFFRPPAGALSSLQKLSLFDTALGSGGIGSLVQCLGASPVAAEPANGAPSGGEGQPPFESVTELDLCGNGLEVEQLQPLLDALREGGAPALRVRRPSLWTAAQAATHPRR